MNYSFLWIYFNNEIYNITAILNSFHDNKNIKKNQFDKNSELKTIGKSAFSHSKIESISIPSKVSKIEKSAFKDCKNLKEVEFQVSSELQLIGKSSFEGSSIENILIPPLVI